MGTTVKFKVQSGFEDESTRDLEFGPFASGAVNSETLRTNAKNFDVEAIQNYYTSDGGASFTGIVGVTIVETTENEINLNVEV